MTDLSSAASCLADLAAALESGQGVESRVRRALAALRRLVPYDRCALVTVAPRVAPPAFVEPELPEPERRRLTGKAEGLLEAVANGPRRGPLDAAERGPAHLAVPLISLDDVAGVLLVERDGGAYSEQDLRLLSVVASQLGAYFSALRLHEAERGATAALRDAVARRTHFLGLLSHELRNPLAPMGNALHILDRVAPGSDAARRARAVLGRQFAHLSRLVNDLLDATRVTSGKVHVQRTRLDLVDLVARTVEDEGSLFSHADVELVARLPQGPLLVDGDGTRLAQVVANVLGNAAKFSRPGGRTEVVVEREGAAGVVRVRDDGVGISPDLLGRLFEPFAQGDETLDRSRGGLGLGLALAKALMELHGGSIEAQSAGPGLGATFTLRIPIAEERAAAPSPPAPAAAAGRRRRILVIEDNVDAAATLQEVLTLAGHEVAVAHDGAEGLARAAAFDPEVVLCDLGLPRMSG